MNRFILLSCLVLLVGLLTLLLNKSPAQATAVAPAATTVTYTPDNTHFANPERGFYHHVETRGSNPSPYHLTLLQSYRTGEKIALIYCITVLDTFVTTPISQSFLDHIQSNLNTVRTAGLKCILRFSYTDIVNNGDGSWPPVPPYGDATKAQMLAHIAQLAPLLQANSDVIATAQMGFIGIWGEGYYTDQFVDDPLVPWEISAAKWQDRRDILDALLAALPPSRMVATRYAEAKQNMLNTTSPLTLSEAYDGSARARTSFHNDCFLASDTDFGTWQSAAGKAFMADETQFLAMGGESCNYNPPRSACTTALEELALFHWSYANIEYHPDVVTNPASPESWQSGGCLDDIRKQLGYRFVLTQGTYDDAARPGHQFSVNITLDNVGFAAPFNPRPVQLLLRHATTGALYAAALPDDPRRWFGGDTAVVSHNICLPASMPTGDYELLLNLPDRAPGLRTRPEYALLFANAGGVQETATGYNDLRHTLGVSAAAPAVVCSSAIEVAPVATSFSAPLLAIGLSGGSVGLAWNPDAAHCTLDVHASATPYFAAAPGTLFDDTLTAGTTAHSLTLETAPRFYRVQAGGCDGSVTAVSNQVGSFPFAIVPGS